MGGKPSRGTPADKRLSSNKASKGGSAKTPGPVGQTGKRIGK